MATNIFPNEAEAIAARVQVLLSRKDAARVLGISVRATDSLIASGDLPCLRFGATVRIRPSAIQYLLEARETRSNPRNARRPRR